MMLYKVLRENGKPFHGGIGQWSLPENDGPGDWMPPVEGKLMPCENGYHLCRLQDLLNWFGPAIFEAEYRGERLDYADKVVVREARLLRQLPWDERVARQFACDCAEHVLHIYESSHPADRRPRQAIEVARRFANGLATEKELAAARAAAGAAAWAATEGAAWAAAWAAAETADWAAAETAAWTVSETAAWAAAWTAAEIATWAASETAAWAAEQEWQVSRLMKYISKGK